MKKILLSLALMLGAMAAQAQSISLDDVANYRYYPRRVYGLRPTADGNTYSRLSDNGGQILECSYQTGETLSTLFDVNATSGEQIAGFDDYEMASDGRHILIQTQKHRLYRRSFTAEYYIYDRQNRQLTRLSEGGAQECAHLSPDGTMVAFVRGNNLFVKHLQSGNETQVTTGGRFNYVINGKPDWVYEEEFEYNCAYTFTADSKMLAWVRFDETAVPTFRFQVFAGAAPRHEEYALYPGVYEYKYPKAGENNSQVTAWSYDIASKQTRQLSVPLDSDGYIPRLQATDKPDQLVAVTLNRLQNRCDFYTVDARKGTAQLLMRETNSKYVDLSYYSHIDFALPNITVLSDRDGWQHLYLYDKQGRLQRQLTKGEFDVKDYYGTDGTYFYYASDEGSPLEQYIYRVDAKGRKQQLTKQQGVNSAAFSADCAYFINTFSSIHTPTEQTICDRNGKTLRTLCDNSELRSQYDALQLPDPELFTFTTSEGVSLNGWMVKPHDFDPAKRYPVLLYQYSGPGNQQVHNAWGNGIHGGLVWEHRMAEMGCIVACVDGRGTGGRGSEFLKCTYMTMGDKESKDQVETAIYMGSLPYVDADRIAIWGWSFGGFNTIMSMTEGRKVFRCGVAVAPVTDWRYYDSAYTERFMRTPQENPSGYDISPLHRYHNLSGHLLICHGLADDNVHFQNTAELAEQLTQAGIQFEMHAYTNRDHGISGGNTTRHLFERIETFLCRELEIGK